MLGLFATIVNKLKTMMEPEVPRVLEATFENTLGMITRNMEDYPEHRWVGCWWGVAALCWRVAGFKVGFALLCLCYVQSDAWV